jgi:hypothetical protein
MISKVEEKDMTIIIPPIDLSHLRPILTTGIFIKREELIRADRREGHVIAQNKSK